MLQRKLKPKKCKQCKRQFQPYITQQNCCSGACYYIFAAKRELGKRRKEKREWRAKNKTLSTLCKEAQKDVNRYVRVRDQAKGCISCAGGVVEDAGRFFPIGSKYRCNRLRFDTEAIHGQCRKCNSYVGGGNLHGYIAGLESRYGRAFVDDLYELKAKADQGLLAPLTKEEVRSIAKEHRKLARELDRG